jgi:hypothetical protein
MINKLPEIEKEDFYEALCSECEREGLAYRREPERVYIEDFAYFVYISEKKIKARNYYQYFPPYTMEFDEKFVFSDRGYAFNLINRAMLKLALEKEPGNYALRECCEVFEKLPLNYEYGISYKVEDVIGSVSYQKLIESRVGRKLNVKYRRLSLQFLETAVSLNLQEDEEFILDLMKKDSAKVTEILKEVKFPLCFPDFKFSFLLEFLGIGKKIGLERIWRNKIILSDILKMAEKTETNGILQKLLKVEDAAGLERLHDRISKKYRKKIAQEIVPRELDINEKFYKISEAFSKDRELSFLKLITDEKELYDEGVIQENCVHSYVEEIESGICGIFSGIYNGRRYTVEIVRKGKLFECGQCLGRKNENDFSASELKRKIGQCLKRYRKREEIRKKKEKILFFLFGPKGKRVFVERRVQN